MWEREVWKQRKWQQKHNPVVLTSIKVSMLSIRAWARPMMNWFTHAIAWDLRERQTTWIYDDGLNRESQGGKAQEDRKSVCRSGTLESEKHKPGVPLTWSLGCSAWKTARIWGSWCWEVCSGHHCPTALMNPRRSSAKLQMNPEMQREKSLKKECWRQKQKTKIQSLHQH